VNKCEAGLVCLQRNAGDPVPGCVEGSPLNTDTDYCIRLLPSSFPSENPSILTSFSPSQLPSSQPSYSTPAPTPVPTTTNSGGVTFLFDANRCFNRAGDGNVLMAACTGAADQLLSYESSTQRIVMSGQGCLEWDTVNPGNSMKIAPCQAGNNQRWWYDGYSRLRSYHDATKCADDSGSDLYMGGCVSCCSIDAVIVGLLLWFFLHPHCCPNALTRSPVLVSLLLSMTSQTRSSSFQWVFGNP
jgi:Ricin-type beta-trefoil lectin domain